LAFSWPRLLRPSAPKRTPDWALLLGPENDQLILIDAHTLLVYDETLHTIDHPDG